MGSGEYRLYLERHGEDHSTWPCPPPEPSSSLPSIPVEDQGDPGDFDQGQASAHSG